VPSKARPAPGLPQRAFDDPRPRGTRPAWPGSSGHARCRRRVRPGHAGSVLLRPASMSAPSPISPLRHSRIRCHRGTRKYARAPSRRSHQFVVRWCTDSVRQSTRSLGKSRDSSVAYRTSRRTVWLAPIAFVIVRTPPRGRPRHFATLSRVVDGTVKLWNDDEGWGVLASPQVPGDVWAHFSHIVATGLSVTRWRRSGAVRLGAGAGRAGRLRLPRNAGAPCSQ
jgi:hypothetical protein